MGKGAILIGVLFILVGAWGVFKTINSSAPFWVLIYPLVSIGIGFAMIILYKQEGKIEQRKDIKEGNSKK